MSQKQLEIAVARATGESLRTIRQRGFSVENCSEPELTAGAIDPEQGGLDSEFRFESGILHLYPE